MDESRGERAGNCAHAKTITEIIRIRTPASTTQLRSLLTSHLHLPLKLNLIVKPSQALHWTVFSLGPISQGAIQAFVETLDGLEGVSLARYYPDTDMIYLAYCPKRITRGQVEALARNLGVKLEKAYPG